MEDPNTLDSSACGMDKRRAGLFLLLVVVALGLVGLMFYGLFFATPHANPGVQSAPHSRSTLDQPAGRSH